MSRKWDHLVKQIKKGLCKSFFGTLLVTNSVQPLTAGVYQPKAPAEKTDNNSAKEGSKPAEQKKFPKLSRSKGVVLHQNEIAESKEKKEEEPKPKEEPKGQVAQAPAQPPKEEPQKQPAPVQKPKETVVPANTNGYSKAASTTTAESSIVDVAAIKRELAPIIAQVSPETVSKELSAILAKVDPDNVSKELAAIIAKVDAVNVSKELAPIIAQVTPAHVFLDLAPIISKVDVDNVANELAPIIARVNAENVANELAPILAKVNPVTVSEELAPIIAQVNKENVANELAPLIASVNPENVAKDLSSILALINYENVSNELAPLIAKVDPKVVMEQLAPLLAKVESVAQERVVVADNSTLSAGFKPIIAATYPAPQKSEEVENIKIPQDLTETSSYVTDDSKGNSCKPFIEPQAVCAPVCMSYEPCCEEPVCYAYNDCCAPLWAAGSGLGAGILAGCLAGIPGRHQGRAGVEGDPGPIGPVGFTGPKGPQGPIGPKGDQGPNGFQGVTGPTGDQGLSGVGGNPGDNGSQGLQGPTGNQGQNGVQGDPGDVGAIGAAGPTGDQGQTGPQGAPCCCDSLDPTIIPFFAAIQRGNSTISSHAKGENQTVAFKLTVPKSIQFQAVAPNSEAELQVEMVVIPKSQKIYRQETLFTHQGNSGSVLTLSGANDLVLNVPECECGCEDCLVSVKLSQGTNLGVNYLNTEGVFQLDIESEAIETVIAGSTLPSFFNKESSSQLSSLVGAEVQTHVYRP